MYRIALEKKEGDQQERAQSTREAGTLNEVGLVCKKESLKGWMIKCFILSSPLLASRWILPGKVSLKWRKIHIKSDSQENEALTDRQNYLFLVIKILTRGTDTPRSL